MKAQSKLFLSLFFFASITAFAQDCSILKNNNFTYTLNGDLVQVEFKEDSHIERHKRGKYFIISSINWISDCEYELKIKRVTLPNFPFKVGNKIRVKVSKIKDDKVYFTSTIENFSWEGKLTKQKKKVKKKED